MTQRSLSALEAHGGIRAARKAAKARSLHLLRLVDDRGNELVAASKHPFKVIC